ncbi:hypothetical protein BKA61DRAFT_735467 [Leptodontidium sp. MPI-SDFR-AT-0119]|nr:hypothetical protein BKA61DRAFT_735467 [Leptodontidium sp. MPI-SDFR-AT-0119]
MDGAISRETWFCQTTNKLPAPRWMALIRENLNQSHLDSSSPTQNIVSVPVPYSKTGLQNTIWPSDDQQGDDEETDKFEVERSQRQGTSMQLLNTSARKRPRKMDNNPKARTHTSRELEAASIMLSSTTDVFERPVAMFYTAADYYTPAGELNYPNPPLPPLAFLPKNPLDKDKSSRSLPTPSVKKQAPRERCKRGRDEGSISQYEKQMQHTQRLPRPPAPLGEKQVLRKSHTRGGAEASFSLSIRATGATHATITILARDRTHLFYEELELQERQSRQLFQQRLAEWPQERAIAPRRSKYDISNIDPPRFVAALDTSTLDSHFVTTTGTIHAASSTPSMSHRSTKSMSQPSTPSAKPPATHIFWTMPPLEHEQRLKQYQEENFAHCARNGSIVSTQSSSRDRAPQQTNYRTCVNNEQHATILTNSPSIALLPGKLTDETIASKSSEPPARD